MEYQTPVEHINKVCDYLQTKGNILKRSGPYVRELDEETPSSKPPQFRCAVPWSSLLTRIV